MCGSMYSLTDAGFLRPILIFKFSVKSNNDILTNVNFLHTHPSNKFTDLSVWLYSNTRMI